MTDITMTQAKDRIFNSIINRELSTYGQAYAPLVTEVSISDMVKLTGLSLFMTRNAVMELTEEGYIKYFTEGYTLTKRGYDSESFWKAKTRRNQKTKEWAAER